MVETHIDDEFISSVFDKIIPMHSMLANLRDLDLSHNIISNSYISLMQSLQ
jgi:hypothetical protein